MLTKGLNKCVLSDEYQNKMRTIKEKIEDLNSLVIESEKYLPALGNTKIELEEALESFNIAREYYGMKERFDIVNNMTNADIERLYDAFIQLCDYVEQETENGCGGCPRYKICFGSSGHLFAESLKRIKETMK